MLNVRSIAKYLRGRRGMIRNALRAVIVPVKRHSLLLPLRPRIFSFQQRPKTIIFHLHSVGKWEFIVQQAVSH